MKKQSSIKIEGSASVGTKGQIVIPKNVREKFKLKPGDDLIVLSSDDAIFLVKSESLENMIGSFENIINDL
ncbi:MAG TPA: AbrB/MazE/SpoVT family DNA-binding domain-containing protein [Candidatus Absconditabacterales bacterium]|nr:AbrB/MazE/SpoVT family DNA-binding domain-containing protein [Candidatus Absconditabacterales bacterium]